MGASRNPVGFLPKHFILPCLKLAGASLAGLASIVTAGRLATVGHVVKGAKTSRSRNRRGYAQYPAIRCLFGRSDRPQLRFLTGLQQQPPPEPKLKRALKSHGGWIYRLLVSCSSVFLHMLCLLITGLICALSCAHSKRFALDFHECPPGGPDGRVKD